MAGRKYWTRELLIEQLKGFSEPPRARDFRRDPDRPHYLTFLREFGTWEAALVEAGWPPGTGRRGRRKK